jgi:hypothetical protein
MAVSLRANVRNRRRRRDNHTDRESPQSTPNRPRQRVPSVRFHPLGRPQYCVPPGPDRLRPSRSGNNRPATNAEVGVIGHTHNRNGYTCHETLLFGKSARPSARVTPKPSTPWGHGAPPTLCKPGHPRLAYSVQKKPRRSGGQRPVDLPSTRQCSMILLRSALRVWAL